MTDPYQLLGVDYRADEKEIKNAYKKMVKKNHPDRFQDPKEIERANEKMTEINAAFDQIMEDRRLGVSPAKYRTYNAAERQKREREKKASQFRRYSEEDYARYQERTSQETVYGADYESIQSAIDSHREKSIFGNCCSNSTFTKAVSLSNILSLFLAF